MRTFIKFLIGGLLACLVLLAGLAGALHWWSGQPLAQPAPLVEFRIHGGSSLRAAVTQMRAAGVDVQPDLFVLLARWQNATRGIKAGSYALRQGSTPLDLLDKLTRGEVTQGELTLVEGWTFRQWRARLDQHPDLRHDTAGLSEAELAVRLGLPPDTRLEGRLFPDTYLFDKQSPDIELLARAQRAMQRQLESEWARRAPGLPYRTPDDALIMASIVEKETGRASDRPQVAAVFVNRLQRGMLLQTDPTVIYGIGPAFDGNLRKRDLLTDTPYNTYTRSGLPPTPIAMPGLASLQAALHPASSDALYFVARGDGSSQFSRTLDEHNRAVNTYQRGGR